MKKLTELFAVFTVSLFTLNACHNELQPVEKPAVTHSLKFVAEAPSTKTTASIDNDNKTVDYSWTSDDKNRFEIYEISGETYTKANEVKGVLNEGEMTLTATFGGDPVPGASYIALFNTGVKSEQSATGSTYDQQSDVLISKPVISESIEDEILELQFKRETAFALMTAKNLEGSSIIGASICADKKIVAEYDVQSQSFLEPGSKTIAIANGDNAVSSISNGTADVFFASVPVEGTSLKVRVVTGDENGAFKALYEKSFASGKSIDFARGDVRPFGIQMVKCEDGLTIDLTKDETTTATENEMSWKIPGFVSIMAEKAGSSTPANNFYPGKGDGNTHFFKNSTMAFTPKKGVLIGSIVFKAVSEGYATALANSTWTNASAAVGENNIVTITPILGYQTVFVVLGGTTGGDSFKINYGVAESHDITVADDIANGSVSANVTSAVPGTEITLTPSPVDHYYLDTWIVTNADTETPVAVTDNKFIMPNAAVNVSAIFRHNPYFEKLTTAPADWRGDYLIVYEDGNVAFDGSLTTLDAVSNTKEVTIEENKIEATTEMKAIQFTVDYKSGSNTVYSLKSASGKYISGTTTNAKASNGLNQADSDANYEISFNDLSIESKSKDQQMVLRYNKDNGQTRFRFYKSGQEDIALYKLGEAPRDLTSIEITTMPTKTSYNENECFDPDGLVIKKYFDFGDPVSDYAYADHPSEFSFDPALDTPLKTTDTKVTVTVGGKTAEIEITVAAVASYDVTFMSNGAQYGKTIKVKEGANITFPATNPSVDGVVFMGWTKTPIPGTQQTAPEMVNTAEEKMGNADITFYAVFAKKTDTPETETKSQALQYDTWSYSGSTTDKSTYRLFHSGSYIESAAFDLSKLSKVIVYGGTYGGGSYNKLTIGDGTNTWKSVEVSGNKETGTNTYTDGMALSGTDKLRITCNSGSSSSTGVRISKVEIFTKTGGTTYSDYCTSVATLISVVVSGTPTKTTYVAGESFEPAGLTVTGHYSDGSDKAITDGITWSSPAALTVGQTSVSITATVNGVTSAAYEVSGLTVTAPVTLTKISATGTPSEFWKGDTFNHDGITIKATWSNETETDVTSACEFTGYDMGTPGQQTVTVTYQEKTCQYSIEVKTIANTEQTAYTVTEAKAIIDAGKDLTITQVYVKGIVSQVDSYNSTYKSVTYWISEDGTTTNQFEVYSGKGLNGADFESKDDVKIGADVIIYGYIKKFNSTYEFDKNNYLVSYNVEDQPIPNFIKTANVIADKDAQLNVKEYLYLPDTYSASLSISVKSGVADNVSISSPNVTFLAAGEYTLTITAPAVTGLCAETSGEIKFTVKDAVLESVTIGGTLAKTSYSVGDTFDRTGLTLTANYSDGSHIDVTNDFNTTWGTDPKTFTEVVTSVYVLADYKGVQANKSFDVTVSAAIKGLPVSFTGSTMSVVTEAGTATITNSKNGTAHNQQNMAASNGDYWLFTVPVQNLKSGDKVNIEFSGIKNNKDASKGTYTLYYYSSTSSESEKEFATYAETTTATKKDFTLTMDHNVNSGTLYIKMKMTTGGATNAGNHYLGDVTISVAN